MTSVSSLRSCFLSHYPNVIKNKGIDFDGDGIKGNEVLDDVNGNKKADDHDFVSFFMANLPQLSKEFKNCSIPALIKLASKKEKLATEIMRMWDIIDILKKIAPNDDRVVSLFCEIMTGKYAAKTPNIFDRASITSAIKAAGDTKNKAFVPFLIKLLNPTQTEGLPSDMPEEGLKLTDKVKEQIGNLSVRNEIIRALGNIGDKRALPFLKEIEKKENISWATPNPSTEATIAIKKIMGKDAATYLELGNKRFDAKKYHLAIENYTKAIKLNPNIDALYLNRGAAYCNTDEFELALKDFNKALELNPDITIAYYYRSLAHGKLGHQEQSTNDMEMYNQLKNK